MTDEQVLLAGLGLFAALFLAILLRRVLALLCRVALRTAVGGGVLAALEPFGGLLGLHLGVNLCNALVIGVLGAPGLGLLLMLNWLMAGG
ncbi:MAG: pro-sigmaK processing inhibitor BofA family protein [Clostridiales bacterium]|nr:pro-sigmaK processing inhibitor BofA family protein [Clostridiales bacterium]